MQLYLYICSQSKIDITDDPKKVIAGLSEGAMRDALSILERCMQEEGTITDEVVKELVGIPKTESVNKITKNILEKNTDEALKTINEIVEEGKDITNFLWEIIKYVKDILICKTNTQLEIYNQAEKEEIKKLADATSKERLISIIYELSNLQNDIKWSSQKLIMFQVEIIKLCNQEETITSVNNQSNNENSQVDNKQIQDLQYKISRLEKEINILQNQPRSVTTTAKVEEKNVPVIKPEIKKSSSITLGNAVQNWPKIIDTIKTQGKITLYTNLLNSTATLR